MITHLALIMDGNRRWAKQHGMVPWLGHRNGVKNVEMAVKYCLAHHITYLSLYTFSLENLKRTQQEQQYLFLLIDEMRSKINDFVKEGIKVRFVGNLSYLEPDVRAHCMQIEQATQNCAKLSCQILFCYGGQQEIVAAAQKILEILPAQTRITLELFKQNLWMGNIDDPQIIIRTGGVKRLSNFLLFQAAYAEIRFLDCLWPDFTQEILHATIQDCLQAKKNFGA